jgi:hypothetical protein
MQKGSASADVQIAQGPGLDTFRVLPHCGSLLASRGRNPTGRDRAAFGNDIEEGAWRAAQT